MYTTMYFVHRLLYMYNIDPSVVCIESKQYNLQLAPLALRDSSHCYQQRYQQKIPVSTWCHGRFIWPKIITNLNNVDIGRGTMATRVGRERESFVYILAQRPHTICVTFEDEVLWLISLFMMTTGKVVWFIFPNICTAVRVFSPGMLQQTLNIIRSLAASLVAQILLGLLKNVQYKTNGMGKIIGKGATKPHFYRNVRIGSTPV